MPFDEKAWRAEWKAKRRKAGICIDCSRPAVPKRACCSICAEKSSSRKRTDRADRKAQGICRDCDAPARPGRGTCAMCAEVKRLRKAGPRPPQTPDQRRRYKNHRRELGLCADCGEPAEHSAARCEKCSEIHRKRERLAAKHGRPEYLWHFHQELPLWERALLARGQVRKIRGRFVKFREKKAS